MRLTDPSPDRGASVPQLGPLAHWSDNHERALEEAISRWNLQRVGWMGFESLPWVKALKDKYPDVDTIAHTCTIHDNRFKKQVPELLEEVEPQDFNAVRSYFVGKLALEELSCRLSGSGAGMCDKRASYIQIFEMLKEAKP